MAGVLNDMQQSGHNLMGSTRILKSSFFSPYQQGQHPAFLHIPHYFRSHYIKYFVIFQHPQMIS